MDYALYINGIYDRCLREIIIAQKNNSDLICYLQPYSSSTITRLKSDKPSLESPITIYFSVSDDLSTVRYVGNIVGWEDKQKLSPTRSLFLAEHMNEFQPEENGIYLEHSGKPCKNLISVINVTKLEAPIPLSNFIKTKDGTPLKPRAQPGNWSYVNELPEDFVIDHTDSFVPINFRQGKKYLRQEIIDTYGGQSRSGITTPSNHPLIFLFTSDTGKEFGYVDGWTDEGTFEICGEGQVGDMKYVRGNKAILHHKQNGKELHLFEKTEDRYVRYIAKMDYKSHREDRGPDINGDDRKRIIFELTVDSSLNERDSDFTSTETVEGKKVLRYTTVYERDPKARAEALTIHGYDCKGCGLNFGDFYGEHGRGFIHVHHIKPLSESGETKIDPKTDLIPLCPNCHAMVHKNKSNTLTLDELKEIIK